MRAFKPLFYAKRDVFGAALYSNATAIVLRKLLNGYRSDNNANTYSKIKYMYALSRLHARYQSIHRLRKYRKHTC